MIRLSEMLMRMTMVMLTTTMMIMFGVAYNESHHNDNDDDDDGGYPANYHRHIFSSVWVDCWPPGNVYTQFKLQSL